MKGKLKGINVPQARVDQLSYSVISLLLSATSPQLAVIPSVLLPGWPVGSP